MSDDEVREEKELDLSSNDVVTKYKAAAEILNSKLTLSNLTPLPLLLPTALCLSMRGFSPGKRLCCRFHAGCNWAYCELLDVAAV
jgi:hypothetical protein